jgi:membrane-bound lytic murein transglycosylase D
MPVLHRRSVGLACALAFLTGACAARVPSPAVAPSPAPVVQAPAPPAPDPVLTLLAESNRHFEDGERELQLGHLEMAKTAFNRSLEVLLESSFGARSEPRIREHFDRLVERVSAYEIMALAQGDGFTEKKYEPATIDQLLAGTPAETPDATDAIKQAVADDGAAHDIDIPLNNRVLAFVELFTGRLRGYLTDGLRRGAQYLPMIQDVFRAEGLPLDLAYVPLVESAFKPNALSRAKAKGIWQFMRGTGLENGLKHDWYIDERAEPEKATRAAAKYLKTLYGMFGDWHLALASYNGGPGRVQRALKASGRDNFWAVSETKRYLPRETRDYVPLILAAMIIARNPAQYGIDIEPLDAPLFEKVALPVPTDIRRVAEWIGTSVDSLQDLNPELRRWTTPIRSTDYELKVPAGTAEIVSARLADTRPEELTTVNHYTVKKGETLQTIARRLKVSRTDLADANYLSQKARVQVGQQLVIPREPTQLLAARADTPAPVTESRQLDTVVAASNVEVPSPVRAEQSRTVYRVKRGDTLSSIARFFDTTVASLKSWNRLRGNVLQVGQRLTVFSDRNTTH